MGFALKEKAQVELTFDSILSAAHFSINQSANQSASFLLLGCITGFNRQHLERVSQSTAQHCPAVPHRVLGDKMLWRDKTCPAHLAHHELAHIIIIVQYYHRGDVPEPRHFAIFRPAVQCRVVQHKERGQQFCYCRFIGLAKALECGPGCLTTRLQAMGSCLLCCWLRKGCFLACMQALQVCLFVRQAAQDCAT